MCRAPRGAPAGLCPRVVLVLLCSSSSCVVSFCCSICSPLEHRAGREGEILLLFSRVSIGSLSQDILESTFPVPGDGQISPQLPASALPPKSSLCHESAACCKIPTPLQHIKAPKSREFPFNLHPEWLCRERKSCRLRDSATAVAGEAEAAWFGDPRILLKHPRAGLGWDGPVQVSVSPMITCRARTPPSISIPKLLHSPRSHCWLPAPVLSQPGREERL